jgi:hypothetical protein
MLITREEYRRMEGFVGEGERTGAINEPLGRYVLINLAFLGMGLAACTAVVAGLIWMLS